MSNQPSDPNQESVPVEEPQIDPANNVSNEAAATEASEATQVAEGASEVATSTDSGSANEVSASASDSGTAPSDSSQADSAQEESPAKRSIAIGSQRDAADKSLSPSMPKAARRCGRTTTGSSGPG